MSSNFQKLVALAVFFLSGLCGLGYQIVWSRMFGIGLGHEMPAVLAVVAAFFGGVALGAWSLDELIGRSPRPGRWYAALELIIGLWGLLLVPLLPFANDSALRVIGIEPSPMRHWTAAFLIPFLALLPSTMAMGATLPAMEKYLAPFTADRKCIGALYACNTLGAVGGTLLSTFFLAPQFGFARTLLLLAGINLFCGVVVLLVEARTRRESDCAPTIAHSGISHRRLDLTLFLTGVLGIGYEVLGVRVLAEVLENTVYSFAATLSIYLLGTALGAGAYQRFGKRMEFGKLIRLLLHGLSIASLLGAWVLAKAPQIYDFSQGAFGNSLLGVLGSEMLVAASVFGLPTICMGATFSHLAQSSRRGKGGVGRAVAWNTLGSAMAPILFGVILLPALGAKWSLVTVSAGYLALLPRISRTQWIGLVLPAVLILALPRRLQIVQPPPGGKLLEYREGMMDSVAVVEHFDGHRSLLVNNRFTMGGTGAADAARRHAHIPLLLHREPKRALFLGLGTGITFAGAGPHADLKADGVELIPEITEVLRYFAPHNSLRPGLQVRIADARRFVRASHDQYDVIVADLFHPARDGAGALYTLEHFQAIRSRLAPGGLFCQWLPLYQLDEAMVQVIVRTYLEVFPQARAFLLRFNVDTPVLGLIASTEPALYPADWFAQRVQDPDLMKELKGLTLLDGLHLFGSFVAGPQALQEFSKHADLNTDDRPVVIFRAPLFALRRKETPYGRLFTLLERGGSDPAQLIEQSGSASNELFRAELVDFIKARNTYLRGLAAESDGNLASALDAYIDSARTSDRFSTAYARCLTIAVQRAKSHPDEARKLLERLAEAQPSRPVANELLKRLFPP